MLANEKPPDAICRNARNGDVDAAYWGGDDQPLFDRETMGNQGATEKMGLNGQFPIMATSYRRKTGKIPRRHFTIKILADFDQLCVGQGTKLHSAW